MSHTPFGRDSAGASIAALRWQRWGVEDAGRLCGVHTGRMQLQRWIEGTDVPVHVVGARWLATAIRSTSTDYRYAAGVGADVGADVAMAATESDLALGERLVRLATSKVLAGIDHRLRYASPGFTFYVEATGQPSAAAIGDLLRKA